MMEPLPSIAEREVMTLQDRKSHWESVYGTKGEQEVSWFQEVPTTSLDLLGADGVSLDSAVIDIGAGASRLVDALLARGYRNVSVLDVSGAALATARARLGSQADAVHWIESDITQWTPADRYDVWHDRAVLHFLLSDDERTAYRRTLAAAVRPGGLIVIGTFDLDGPERCSGLTVQRYSGESLAQMLGDGFERIDTRGEEHATPWGSVQRFQFSRFRRTA
jgi:2-polyprenyl-3-methyl-5-hydroxy-6-metoxy-1,4-benzoquinol methylase